MANVIHQAFNDKERKEFVPACGQPWTKTKRMRATLNGRVTCKRCRKLNRQHTQKEGK